MRVLENLEPGNVFSFFEDICRIPHGSGNTEQISDYLTAFARERNLEYYRDETGNVIIIKEAAPGYESHEPVMLQGHMDMVAVKKPGCPMDMEKEGLHIKISGDSVYAENTSLGGDDGIAVAYGLALLDGKEYRHPRIELVITVDEETGMEGARAIDFSPCKAHTLINLDSEEEGFFLTGCAGGARVNYSSTYDLDSREGIPCTIKVSGLLGGHSGAEIHKERGNANCLLGRVLAALKEEASFALQGMEGGLADNAIPREAKAELLLTGADSAADRLKAEQVVEKLNKALKKELAGKDTDVNVEIAFAEREQRTCMGEKDSERITAFLNSIPHGVQAMSHDMEGLVETSLNLGMLSLAEGKLHAGISVRSSIDSAKYALIGKLKSMAELAGVQVDVTGDYPGWAYRADSPLRDKMTAVYESMYHKKPVVQAIHAGLECGLFAGKIENLDCVSIGPDMKNIHTTEEELSVSSTKRVWEFLLKVLEEM